MMPWGTLDGEVVHLSGHCDLGMHAGCLPLMGTRSECGCPCHVPRSGRILTHPNPEGSRSDD